MQEEIKKFKEICDDLIKQGASLGSIAKRAKLPWPITKNLIYPTKDIKVRASTLGHIQDFIKYYTLNGFPIKPRIGKGRKPIILQALPELNTFKSEHSKELFPGEKTLLDEMKGDKFYESLKYCLTHIPKGMKAKIIISNFKKS